MLNCPTCKFADFEKDKCTRLLNRLPHICPYAEERKPRNHFERLKAMSMEELVVLFTAEEYDGAKCFSCPVPHPCPDPPGEADCRECFGDWLKEDVEE